MNDARLFPPWDYSGHPSGTTAFHSCPRFMQFHCIRGMVCDFRLSKEEVLLARGRSHADLVGSHCVRPSWHLGNLDGALFPEQVTCAASKRKIKLMRIIAGTFRSRILKSLKGQALRPTSDRLRETLFDVLGQDVAASRFLDLFAGTGAIGIEALSRGAAEAVFVENHAPAAALIRRNLESLDIRKGATVLVADALRGLEMLASGRKGKNFEFNYIFLDPPYAAANDYARVLESLGSGNLLAPGGVVIAEHRRSFDLPEEVGALRCYRVLKQGDAALSFYRRAAAAAGKNNSAP